ncbi:MAG: hypothetical protein ACO1OF_13605 [Adhaeribacter sp.]
MKLFKFLLILILVGIIPLACCPNEEVPYELELSKVHLQRSMISINYGDFLIENEIYKEDTLRIYLDLYSKPLSQAIPAFSLAPSAMATSCPEQYFKNLNDKIKKIEISSDTIFNNIAAGSNINSKVRFYNPFSQSFAGVDELIQIFNTKDGIDAFSSGVHYLHIVEKPISRQRHKFKITIDYASGKQQVAETPRIYWQ